MQLQDQTKVIIKFEKKTMFSELELGKIRNILRMKAASDEYLVQMLPMKDGLLICFLDSLPLTWFLALDKIGLVKFCVYSCNCNIDLSLT